MKKLLAIVGPTATGKTDLALKLAHRLNGELVACDSRQLYIGLDIGSGKQPSDQLPVEKHPRYWLIDGIKIWLYDLVDPKERFSVKEYVDQARVILETVWQQGKLPIIVGGTGYYLKGLLEGVANDSVPANDNLRQQLDSLTVQQLQQHLTEIDPQRLSQMNSSDSHNPRRLIRAIELSKAVDATPPDNLENVDLLLIGLTTERSTLNQRIDQRVIKRIEQGMIEEAKTLHQQGLSLDRMRELGLEYRYLAELLDNRLTEEQFITTLQTKIHQFAKRQLTWFKNQSFNNQQVNWVDIADSDYQTKVEKRIQTWYDLDHESQG